MNEKSKDSRVVGWRDGEFLTALPGGILADALGIIIDDTPKTGLVDLGNEQAGTNGTNNNIA